MYVLNNTTIDFNLICQNMFEQMFLEYKSDKKNADIFIESKIGDINIKDINIIMQGNDFLTGYYNGLYTYVLFINNKAMGMINCDNETGKYYCTLIEDDDIFNTEYILVEVAIERYFFTHYNALLFHSSAVLYNDKVILFSAKSGTGKSTHARLWCENYDAKIINDDKNLIVKENDKLYIFGTPISGKEFKNLNLKKEVAGICFLKQGSTNEIKKLSKMQSFVKISNQIVKANDLQEQEIIDSMVNELLSLPIYELSCTISVEAVNLVKDAFFGGR